MVDLAPAQRAVERILLTDRCRLRRNPGGEEDDTLSAEPGELTLTPQTITPYYDGVCALRVESGGDGADTATVTVPLAIVPDEGDVAEIYEARDPGLVGRWFRIDQVGGGTFAVSRRCQVGEVPPWPST